jgi:beta-glucosidase
VLVAEANDTDGVAFERAVAAVEAGASAQTEAAALYDRLTEEERLWLLDGDQNFWPGITFFVTQGYNLRPVVHGAVARLGIPGTRFVDGPRGCVTGNGTAFPVSMARGATWDVELEERVGQAIGREIRAQGGNFFGGVCVNLPRHPAWGRAQETYGDDPYHLGELGAALVRGSQRYVMACAKHYALNSMENARFKVDVQCDEATLHDVYLPHFKRCADEGVSAVMSSYNSVNGEWAGQNRYLLTDVLRDLWRWDGIAVSDFIFGLRDAARSVEAGLDIEEPFRQQRAVHLPAALDEGRATWAAVEQSGRRILATQLRSYASREKAGVDGAVMACEEHRSLAREVAARAMVLLRNQPVNGSPVLPLRDVRSIAVVGRLAREANIGDLGSSAVRPPASVSPADGIRTAFPGATVSVVSDDDPAAAAAAAGDADVAVVVVGYTAADEGEFIGDPMSDPALMALFPPLPADFDVTPLLERAGDRAVPSNSRGGDRRSMRLRPGDEDLIRAVVAANPRTVVAIVAAGAVIIEAWRQQVPATMMMWYAGMEGGHALADVLTGRHNPSGRLPFSIPTSEEHLPFFDPDVSSISYDRYHGQRLLDRLGVAAAYPHGFGLSYTTFAIASATPVEVSPEQVRLRVAVRNTGDCAGRHVVQVYGRRSTGAYRGELLLAGFAVADVPAGDATEVTVDVSLVALAEWDSSRRRRALPAISELTLEVGAHAHDPQAVLVELPGQ